MNCLSSFVVLNTRLSGDVFEFSLYIEVMTSYLSKNSIDANNDNISSRYFSLVISIYPVSHLLIYPFEQ